MMTSKVFFVPATAGDGPEILSKKARAAYMALDLNDRLDKDDFVALKIHFGDKDNTGHVKAEWLRHIATEIRKKTPRAFLTDSNTLYVGRRSNSVEHIRQAWSHGFTPNVIDLPVIIADGLIGRDKHESRDGGPRPETLKIGAAFQDADALLALTHVTGHVQTGIGAALKNIGMGCASRAGKLDQHSVSHPRVQAKACRNCSLCIDYCPSDAILQAEGHVEIDDRVCLGCGECLVVCKFGAIKFRWDADSRRLQEKMAEYALQVKRHFKEKAGFINFLIHVTKDCDCMAGDQARIVEDIGLLASADPVAVDTATAALVLDRSRGKDVFRAGYKVDWSAQLKHGVSIGLGFMDYELVELKV
jgi:uncharacterized Fe-S center protein